MSINESMYDFIVVGGGSAGCVTASRLVKDGGARVLLLEGGWPDRHPFIRMPAGFVRILVKPNKFVRSHVSVPQLQLGGRTVTIEQANVLGGGSSVNAMTYTRGTKEDFDRWAEQVPGWGWDAMLPYFKRQESNQRLAGAHHGFNGPIKVSDAHFPVTDISRSYLLTLQGMGIPYVSDLNCGDEKGCSFIQSTTYRGERWSSARGYIEPIANDSRLEIRYRARVTKVLIEDKKAVGVTWVDEATGEVRTAHTAGDVILTAGAFISPQILLLSGIGDEKALSELGIAVQAHLPGVGQNLQDHHAVSLCVGTHENYGFSNEDRGLKMLKNGLQYLMFKSGPVSSTGSEVTAFFNPLDPQGAPTIQLYCMGTILPQHSEPARVGATLTANLIAPRSRGSVSLRSADPQVPPAVDPRWLTDPEDMTNLKAGLKFLFDVLKTEPFRDKVTDLYVPSGDIQDDAVLEAHIKQTTGTNWHPVGTCKMGAQDDPLAVLDENLRVRGIANLRVFDASMMPNIISANTNATVMAVADRAVDLLLAERHAPYVTKETAEITR